MTKHAPIKPHSASNHNAAPLSLINTHSDKPATIGLEYMTYEQLEEFGNELNGVRQRVLDDLGQKDADYIRRVIKVQRACEVLGRIGIFFPFFLPVFITGILLLGLAKILDNMEIGHNVMHGQWDWMNDPQISSSTWDWDSASTAEAWKHSHNYIHHTYTNIVGKDKDVGYDVFRVTPKQDWAPEFLLQPFTNVLLMLFFEWGVMLHDLDFDAIEDGTKDWGVLRTEVLEIAQKVTTQVAKDYVAFPALAGKRGWKHTLTANITAGILRNIWTNAVIFCGHFPDQAYTFTEEEVAGETRGAWYVRQLLGAVNIQGGKFFHLMTGNLSYQVEHHLFPDMPSSRYAEIAPRVQAVCERYELPYNTGPFWKQWLMVQRTLLRLAFPGGKERTKSPPFRAAAK